MGKIVNAVWNTLGIVPRGLGTIGVGTLDTFKTGANVLTDMGMVVKDTSDKLWDVLSSSWNTGKWYNKLYQVPAGVVLGAGTLVEWAVRTVLEPVRNGVLNVRDVTGNFFKNIGNSIGRLFDTTKPVSDFSFEKLQYKKPTGKNWVSNWAWWKKSNSTSSSNTTSTSSKNSISNVANPSQVAQLQSQLTSLTAQIGQLQSSLATLQAQNQQLQGENQSLKAQISASQSAQSKSSTSSASSSKIPNSPVKAVA